MDIEALKAYMDDPPEETARVCFMYRQSIGARQQAEQRLATARAKVVMAQKEIAAAIANLNKAAGVESGLHDAVVALADPNPSNPSNPPTSRSEP